MTVVDPTARRRLSWRAWPVWALPRPLLTFLLCLEIATVAGSAYAIWNLRPSGFGASRTLLLLALAILFEEFASKASRLRIQLSNELKPDMTSVWSFPAAIALPPGYAIACVTALLCYVWFRQQRPAGEALYRKVSTAATVLAACLVAGQVMRYVDGHFAGIPGGIAGALAVIIALIIYTAVNRGLITCVLRLYGVRGRALFGTIDDNLVELATLCLGGLAALAVLHEPLLTALVLLPMVLLQRAALMRQLEHAATMDFKTGLLNAAAWEQLARRELVRGDRTHVNVAVLILDIDRFKAVNDVHGHLTGDVVLKAIAQSLRTELRGYDLVGRFGGEEFVALLPAVAQTEAVEIADRLRLRINQMRVSDLVPLDEPSRDSTLAVSVGVSCAAAAGADLTELLHAADGALYVAKRNGRNRVQLAGQGTGSAPVGAL
jgi:diguanylate cyclase (GGDEF)-like protein